MDSSDPLDTLVPAWFACTQLGVTKQTFRWWVTSGKLTPANGHTGHRARYRYRDVIEAERATRNSPNTRRSIPRRTVAA